MRGSKENELIDLLFVVMLLYDWIKGSSGYLLLIDTVAATDAQSVYSIPVYTSEKVKTFCCITKC